MDNPWTIATLSEQMLKIFPNLGRLIALRLRESGEEETTMMQISVLHQIKEQPITASEIAKRRKVSLQSASVLAQAMVERGWIVREPNPNDRRQFLLQLTPEGQAKAEVMRQQLSNYLADVLQSLSAEEVAAAQIFLPALNRILAQNMATDNTQDEKQRTPDEEQAPL